MMYTLSRTNDEAAILQANGETVAIIYQSGLLLVMLDRIHEMEADYKLSLNGEIIATDETGITNVTVNAINNMFA